MNSLYTYVNSKLTTLSPKPIQTIEDNEWLATVRPRAFSGLYDGLSLCSFMDGYFWMCNPLLLGALLDTFLPASLEVRPGTLYLIGYTSLSVLYVLEENTRLFRINLNESNIVIIDDPRLFAINLVGLSDLEILLAIALTYWIEDDLSLHRSAVSRLGLLERGEVYGFFPALQFGGGLDPTCLKRTSALEHWIFIKQLENFACYTVERIAS